MQTLYFQKTSELKRNLTLLEKKLNIKLMIKGKKVVVHSENPIDEYEASQVLDAINFGFSARKALLIKEQEMQFRIINIKNFTKKKNLKQVRARVIGTKGKTKKTIEHITNCHLVIKNNEIGLIGSPESIEELITALANLIRGSKQSNTYRYLEKTKSGRLYNTKDIN